MIKSEKSWPLWLRTQWVVRIIFAGVLVYLFMNPLLNTGGILLAKDAKSIIITPVSQTLTETKQLSHAAPKENKSDTSTLEDHGGKPEKTEKTEKTESKKGTATQQVWIYGLQLVAWIVMLGLLLWTIVALIRDE